MKIPSDSPNRAFVSKDPPAGKAANTAVNTTAGKAAAPQGSPPPKQAFSGITGNAALFSQLKLPPDSLSRALVGFARFFSLPLEPKLLAALRRDALGAPAREAAALGAAAAADKGIKLGEKALARYAAAIEGSMESFVREAGPEGGPSSEKSAPQANRRTNDPADHEHGQDSPPNPEGEGSPQDRHNADQHNSDKQGADQQQPKGCQAPSSLRDMGTDILAERPLLDLLNRVPGKGGRWVVIPFSFSENGVEFAVSVRILLHEGLPISAGSLVTGHLCADIKVTRLNREQQRWLVALERAGDSSRAELRVFSGSEPRNFSAAEKKRIQQELAAALDLPVDRVAFKEDGLLFAESRENVLSPVNEEV